MKKISDFADDINKCSKCGKCQEVCPVYKLTGNDCAVSRGKFVMLQGVLKGELKLSKTIEKYLDLCLKCGKCKDFCPSDIDVCEIFNTAKHEYVKDKFYGKITRFLQSPKVFDKILNIFRLLHKFTRCEILKQVQDDMVSSTNVQSVVLPLAVQDDGKDICNAESDILPKAVQDDRKVRLLYFKGCANALNPKSENAMKKVLAHYDVELIEKDFECCGVPFLSSGNPERYEEVKKYNLDLLKGGYDYVITDCASCESALKNYQSAENIINICHFLAIQNKKFVFKKNLKVTFHKPCHLKSDAFLQPLFAKCENIEYIEAKDYEECCGFAGEFALRNPKLSFQMTRQKAKNLADTGADVILTACPACIIGIHQGFLGKKHPKIMNLIEFLALADEIIEGK